MALNSLGGEGGNASTLQAVLRHPVLALVAPKIFWIHLAFDQAGSMVHQKHARAFMRTLGKPGEVWRSLANPQHLIHENLPDIHQSAGEGPPTFTRVLAKVPSVCGWPSECAQFDKASVLSHGRLVLTVGEMSFLECCENNVLGFPTQGWMTKTLTICKPPPHPPPSQKIAMIGLVSRFFFHSCPTLVA